jgi:hypothetical protein
MKKLIFGLIAVVMLRFVGNANPRMIENDLMNQELINTINPKVMIHIDITWGRKSKGCKGFGICDVDFDVEIDNRNTQFLESGFIATTNDKGGFVILVNEKGLEKIKSIFQSDVIVLEEKYELPSEICTLLSLKKGYTLNEGKYKLSSLGDGNYSISFN